MQLFSSKLTKLYTGIACWCKLYVFSYMCAANTSQEFKILVMSFMNGISIKSWILVSFHYSTDFFWKPSLCAKLLVINNYPKCILTSSISPIKCRTKNVYIYMVLIHSNYPEMLYICKLSIFAEYLFTFSNWSAYTSLIQKKSFARHFRIGLGGGRQFKPCASD
jgi:hypothetical protein